MANFLYTLGRSAYRRTWQFVAVWLLLLIGVAAAATAFGVAPSTTFTIPGLDSITTQEKMQERFPDSGNAVESPTGSIVVQAPEGETLTSPETEAAVQDLVSQLQGLDFLADTESIVDPVLASAGMAQQMTPALQQQGLDEAAIADNLAALSPMSPDQRTGTISVTFDTDSAADIAPEDITRLTDILGEANGDDLTVAYSGNAFTMAASEIEATSELIGMAVAALVLAITFGSIVAAGMPLISAVVGVGIGVMGVQLATAFTDSVNEMTPVLASMIGLAVGIDYALFIVSRFRSELINLSGGNDLHPKEVNERIRGLSREQRAHAMGLAVGKAGSAVVFAGLTVVIALVALSIINIPFLTAMAIAAAATVVVAVGVALSFLPAVLGLVGTRIFSARVVGVRAPDPENEKPTMGLKWVRRIRARPWAHLGVGVILLALLAIPAAQMRLAMPTDGSAAPGTPERIAYDITSDAFGPGRNAPMIALVDAAEVDPAQRQAAVAEALTHIQQVDGVTNAQVIQTTDNLDTAQILITPEFGATDERTSETLTALRDSQDSFQEQTGATYGVTGATPIFDDISSRLSDALVPYIAIVLVLAFLVLLVVFRSIWVPLIAAMGFALSVAATFGVTVAVFQEGWLGIISDPQPLLSFLPIMLIGLVFGLAMDYQVFLVTRMREGWAHGKTAGNATSNGFKHGARVVTAAALIMISVFAAFMAQDMVFIKTMGFALAIAVFFDAFVVRMMIIPATMFLLDERAWWLPGWLDRILPRVDIEGESLAERAVPAAS